MVRPYIDAISLVSESNTILIKTIENIKNTFKKYDLNFTSTIISAESLVDASPFLDVDIFLFRQIKRVFSTPEISQKLQL